MKVRILVPVAGLALLLTACGGFSEKASSTESASAATLTKAVGEQAGNDCDPDDKGDCALDFSITAITPIDPSTCSEYLDVPEDSKLYRVEIDAEAKRPSANSDLAPGFLLITDNWSSLDSDGYTKKVVDAVSCGNEEAGAFYQPVEVGQKKRGTLVFALPENAVALQLTPQGGGVWEWDLAKATKGSSVSPSSAASVPAPNVPATTTVTEVRPQQAPAPAPEPEPAPEPAPVACGDSVPAFDGRSASSTIDFNGDCFVDESELQAAVQAGLAG